ncbi:MAG: ankyrin repeat domain-containing protein [Acidobacteriia bacterium]|nr:ankyrin repeat domain-containing protein [Terriglobia bacterium]
MRLAFLLESIFLTAITAAWGLTATPDLRLLQAVKSQDEASARALLEHHADVNAQQGDGTTALHWAAYHDDIAIADALIRAGARVNTPNDLGSTPLHLACNNRSAAMVERLLAAKANPNAKLLNGETVLMTCARAGSAQAVKALLVHGADPKAAEPEHNQTALMWAAANRHPEVTALLIEFGAEVRARSRSYSQTVVGEQTQRAGREELNYTVARGGSTPLLFAARSGDADSAKLLLARGADPNDSLPDGTSALVLAAHSGQRGVAIALLEKGANPNDLGIGYTALHAAILRSDLELVKALLAHGADPNIRMTKATPVRRNSTDYFLLAPLIGSTPYLLAAKFLEPEMMQALLEGGADPKLTMPDGATALMLASGSGSPNNADRRGINVIDFGKVEPEAKVLPAVEAAFSAHGDVNSSDNAGNTALHSAVSHLYPSVVRFLLEKNAGVNARNKAGQTPSALLTAPARPTEKPTAATSASPVDSGSDGTDQAASQIAEMLAKHGGTK